MKKKTVVLSLTLGLLFLLILPFSRADLLVTPDPKASSIIIGSNNSAVFNLVINSTQNDEISIYALAGMVIDPINPVKIQKGQNIIEIKASPSSILRTQRGTYNFEYRIENKAGKVTTDYLKISIVDLRDSLSFKTSNIQYGDKEAKTIIKNLYDSNIENLNIKLSSPFFNEERRISLRPNEEIVITSQINETSVESLPAGQYVLRSESSLANIKASFDNSFNYAQKEEIVQSEDKSGWIIRKTYVEKSNEGNVPTTVQIQMKKDIFTRLVTIYSAESDKTERNGLFVTYTWEKRLEPSEKFTVSAITNYTFPFFFVLFIVIISLLLYAYLRTNVLLTKRVSYVKTKNGEFALKVRVHVKAHKFVEDIQIMDRLPGMTTLYEKFGTKPDKIEHATRRLIWNIERLNAGEERVFSYIIYSKVKVVGKFELPSASATYTREGKTQEAISNRTFFVADMHGSQ